MWQYYRDELVLDAAGAIIDFPAANNKSVLFEFKTKVAGKTGNGKNNTKIMVPLKYLRPLLFETVQ